MHRRFPAFSLAISLFLALFCSNALGQAAAPQAAVPLAPYAGPSEKIVDVSTLTGKLMCGYQGWFSAQGDGAERGFRHWMRGRGRPGPGNVAVDIWPDLSELGPDERFDTDLKHEDGRVAQAFSSYHKATVLRHFAWMRQYGIDGAFVQRFPTDLSDPKARRHMDTVLAHCREGANREGRAYALMYDLSGLKAGWVDALKADWRSLRTTMKLGEDPAYLRHRGKPLVAVWGVGFGDGRAYTLAQCAEFLRFLKEDPAVGGLSLMVGTPSGWRELKGDAAPDKALHEVLALADVISPWTVGRYATPADVARHAEKVWRPDMAWCQARGVDYLPVVFPGFSWKNLHGGPLNQIPRLKGRFLWSQFVAAKQSGANMIYVAMFDEVDEATAIFKCVNDPPRAGGASFIDHEGLPSDHYLKLTGLGGKLLRGEIPPTPEPP